MEQWNKFKEKMSHEMSGVPISLLIEGYKLDNDKKGIKIFIGCNALKGVDYIANSKSLAFVEFSDLYSHRDKINKQIQTFKNSVPKGESPGFEGGERGKFIKKTGRTVQKELVEKYKDTLSIVKQMQKQKYCLELDERYEKDEAKKRYLIIIAPFHHSIAQEDKVDIVRRIDGLANTISRCFPPAWNVSVEIVSIENFAKPK